MAGSTATAGDDRSVAERRADALTDLASELLTHDRLDLRGLLNPDDPTPDDDDSDDPDSDDTDSDDTGGDRNGDRDRDRDGDRVVEFAGRTRVGVEAPPVIPAARQRCGTSGVEQAVRNKRCRTSGAEQGGRGRFRTADRPGVNRVLSR